MRTESCKSSSQCHIDLALGRTVDKAIVVYDVVLREVTRALWEILTSAFWTRKWNRGQGARQGGGQKRSNEALAYQGGRDGNVIILPPHHVFSRTIPGRQSNNEKSFRISYVIHLYFEVNITGNLKCMYIVVFLPLNSSWRFLQIRTTLFVDRRCIIIMHI